MGSPLRDWPDQPKTRPDPARPVPAHPEVHPHQKSKNHLLSARIGDLLHLHSSPTSLRRPEAMAAPRRPRLLPLLLLLALSLSLAAASAFQSDELLLHDDDEFEGAGAAPRQGRPRPRRRRFLLPPTARGQQRGGGGVQRRAVRARARPRRRVRPRGVLLRPPQVLRARLPGPRLRLRHCSDLVPCVPPDLLCLAFGRWIPDPVIRFVW